jgi:uncharacterized protein YbaP (TraB family)
MQRARNQTRNSFGRRRFAAAVALAATLATASQARRAAPFVPAALAAPVLHARPALWVVQRGATTIYLFGTFHTLDPRTAWFDDAIRTAFDRSGELVLETVVPDDPREIGAIAARHVVTGPMTSRGAAPLKPYFAQTRAVLASGRQMGMSVDQGADAVLRRFAVAQGKPIEGLESFEDQLSQLATIPMAPPPPPGPVLVSGIAPAPPPTTLTDLFNDWTEGDTGAFALTIASLKRQSPEAYRILIADRNARWGQWIANRLDQPGTVFLAVGSGHLAGPDSVQQWLAAHGIAATRVG